MKIYKYRPSDKKQLTDIVTNQQFWFASWNAQNDPMEGYFRYFEDEHTEWKLEDFITEKKKLSISSFSLISDSMLMWSHYADNHKGVCFEIDTDLNRNPEIRLEVVKYKKKISFLPSVTPKQHNPISVLSTKLTPWKYEKEIRAFSPNGPNELAVGKITKIIFGLRCDETTKQDLRKINQSIPVETAEFCFEKSKLIA
jgi:hypothetical protein